MVNPNECGRDFSSYDRAIMNQYERLSPEEQSSRLVKLLMEKHVRELCEQLTKGKVTYFFAIEHESYCKSLAKLENMGFKVPIEKEARWHLLRGKYQERINGVMEELRSPKNCLTRIFANQFERDCARSHAESLAIEVYRISEKMFEPLEKLGTSKEELRKHIYSSCFSDLIK